MNRILDLDSKFVNKNREYYYINVYIPYNLDIIYLINSNLEENLRDIILKKSPIFPHQQNFLKSLCLLVNKICWLQITAKKTPHGYLDYRAQKLSREIGLNGSNFNFIINILVKLDIIEINHSYSNNKDKKHSKSFKFTSKYAYQKPKLFEPRFIITSKETKKFIKVSDKKLNDVENYIHENIKNITFSIGKSELLDLVKQNSDKKSVERSVYQSERNISAIISQKKEIGSDCWMFSRSNKNGRLNNNITSLKKELRKYLIFNGMPFVELDVHACQPLLLIDLYNYSESIHKNNERDIYYSLFKSNFYESFAALSGDLKLKDDIKLDFIKILNSKHEEIDTFDIATKSSKLIITRTFKKHFPVLWSEILKLKTVKGYLSAESSQKGIHSQFAYFLQKLESQIVIDLIGRELMKLNIVFFTVHDCIAVIEKDVSVTKNIMESQFEKFIGFKPIIKQK